MKKFIPILLIMLLSACATTKHYEGDERTDAELAVVHIEKMGPVNINEINGKFRGIGLVNEFKFLPGKVSLLVTYSPRKKRSPNKIDLECTVSFVPINFIALAGKNYEIKYELGRYEWKVWVIEAKTKKLIVDKIVTPVKHSSGKNLIEMGRLKKLF